MKNLLIIVVALSFSANTMAQTAADKTIPPQVERAFMAKFPDGKVQQWQIKKEGYIARFTQGEKRYFACFLADGSWKGTESKIKWTRHLPESVKKGWERTEYITWKVNAIKQVETPEQSLYVLHVNNGPLLDANHYDVFLENRVLFFTSDGKLIKKEVMGGIRNQPPCGGIVCPG